MDTTHDKTTDAVHMTLQLICFFCYSSGPAPCAFQFCPASDQDWFLSACVRYWDGRIHACVYLHVYLHVLRAYCATCLQKAKDIWSPASKEQPVEVTAVSEQLEAHWDRLGPQFGSIKFVK